MSLNKTIDFYKKIKNEYDNTHNNFFIYFEITWLILDPNNKFKYDNNFW